MTLEIKAISPQAAKEIASDIATVISEDSRWRSIAPFIGLHLRRIRSIEVNPESLLGVRLFQHTSGSSSVYVNVS